MKQNVTLPQSLVVAILVMAVGGATSALKDYFGDSAAAKQIKAMRDREVDTLERRIASLELAARTCKP